MRLPLWLESRRYQLLLWLLYHLDRWVDNIEYPEHV